MGSDAWETESWKKERDAELERVSIANEKMLKKAKKILIDYFMEDCSYDGALDHANELLPKIVKALKWKGEEIDSYYK